MRRRLLPATLLALAVLATSALPASARRHHRAPALREPPSASEIADRVDARIAQLKAELRLNEDQAKNWPAVQSALHDIAIDRAKRFFDRTSRAQQSNERVEPEPTGRRAPRERGWRDPSAAGEPRPNAQNEDAAPTAPPARAGAEVPEAVQAMRRQADYLADRANDLRKLADAATPLYASLDERQRRRFLQYLRRNFEDSER